MVVLLLLGTLGASVAFMLINGERVPLQPKAATARLTEDLTEPHAEQRELDKAKAADLAASLKMLDQAEAERVKVEAERAEKAQLAAAQAEEQRKATLAARQLEEQERDRARHDAVTRDLDTAAFQKKRGNVQITMYSTDWCGVCKRARAYMHAQRIPFKEFDIEDDAQARDRAHALNPRGGVPVITVDKELLVGFSPESLEEHISRAAHARKM